VVLDNNVFVQSDDTVIMIGVGYMMYKHPPKSINAIYGYRTARSMKNDETWKFAHDCCGRLWFKLGFILLIPP